MASSASAESVLTLDSLHDVWGPQGQDPNIVLNVDLHAAFIYHRPRAFVVKQTYVDLEEPTTRLYYQLDMIAAAGPNENTSYYSARVDLRPGQPGGRHTFVGPNNAGCRGMTHEIEYWGSNTGGSITLRIPRSCLKSPTWIEWKGFSKLANPVPSAGGWYEDDMLSTGRPLYGPYSDPIYPGKHHAGEVS